jgi:hypothetical protein
MMSINVCLYVCMYVCVGIKCLIIKKKKIYIYELNLSSISSDNQNIFKNQLVILIWTSLTRFIYYYALNIYNIIAARSEVLAKFMLVEKIPMTQD